VYNNGPSSAVTVLTIVDDTVVAEVAIDVAVEVRVTVVAVPK
jgi:hypothetical protein